jgi:hypothetical protein
MKYLLIIKFFFFLNLIFYNYYCLLIFTSCSPVPALGFFDFDSIVDNSDYNSSNLEFFYS